MADVDLFDPLSPALWGGDPTTSYQLPATSYQQNSLNHKGAKRHKGCLNHSAVEQS